MSARIVLDSYSLICYLENQVGAEKVSELIKRARDKGKPLLLSVINWGEIYYILCRTAGRNSASTAMQNLDTLPIEIVPADRPLTQIAAEIKAAHKMSYADCFAAALAISRRAELVTGDKEFKEIEHDVKLVWL